MWKSKNSAKIDTTPKRQYLQYILAHDSDSELSELEDDDSDPSGQID